MNTPRLLFLNFHHVGGPESDVHPVELDYGFNADGEFVLIDLEHLGQHGADFHFQWAEGAGRGSEQLTGGGGLALS